jgi:pimeloyl-ACP methyl ester carboxylesterase
MATIQVDGAALYYRVVGAGRPLLIIHGSGANADLSSCAERQLSERHRVITYDRRGHSRSGTTPAALPGYLKRQTDDAACLLRALDAAPAVVVGWSMGGVIALCLALEHPELVSRLVLGEPPLHAAQHRPPLSSIGPLLKTRFLAAIGRKQAAMATFFRMLLVQPDGGNSYDALDEATREGVLANAATLLHELQTGTGEELTPERIRGLRCPISAIRGGGTLEVFAAATERLHRILPQMRVVTIPGAGHLSVLTHPAEFVRIALQE